MGARDLKGVGTKHEIHEIKDGAARERSSGAEKALESFDERYGTGKKLCVESLVSFGSDG